MIIDTASGWGVFNGHFLKLVREGRYLSQEQLGKEIGVSGSTISVWENVDRTPGRSYPDAKQLRELCMILQVNPLDFLFLADQPLITTVASNTTDIPLES